MKLNNVKVPYLVIELNTDIKIQLTHVGTYPSQPSQDRAPTDGIGNPGHPSQDRAPTNFSRVIGSFNDIGMSTNCLRGLDDATQEEFENSAPDRIVIEHVSSIIKLYFEQKSVLTQAQILHGLIKHKK